jgi:uncharacterized Rossmann fold enzyme
LDFPLASEWHDAFYQEALLKLGFSYQRDVEARDELRRLLKLQNPSLTLAQLPQMEKNPVFVCGAGPSLVQDIQDLYGLIRKSRYLKVAADGALDALEQAMILPQIVVSDLDSASEESLISQSKERALLVHAHGDNINLLKELVPRFGRRVIGTTQVEPKDNVLNLGGLTDGDRSCYLASALKAKIIVLIGMDFGESEGEYSKARHDSGNVSKEKKRLKIEIGRRSLEFLIAKRPDMEFLNVTNHGENILGSKKIWPEDLIKGYFK